MGGLTFGISLITIIEYIKEYDDDLYEYTYEITAIQYHTKVWKNILPAYLCFRKDRLQR